MGDLLLRTRMDGSNFNQEVTKMGTVLGQFGSKVAAEAGEVGGLASALSRVGSAGGILAGAILGIGTVIGAVIVNMKRADEVARQYAERLSDLAKGSTSAAGAIAKLDAATQKAGAGGAGSLLAGAEGAQRSVLKNDPEAVGAMASLGISREQAVLSDSEKLVRMLARGYEEAADKSKAYLALVKLIGAENAANIQKSASEIKKLGGEYDGLTEHQIAIMQVEKRRADAPLTLTDKGLQRLTPEQKAAKYKEEGLLNRAARGITVLMQGGKDEVQEQMDKNAQEQAERRRSLRRAEEQERSKEQNVKRMRGSVQAIEEGTGLVDGRPAKMGEIEDYRKSSSGDVMAQLAKMTAQAKSQGRAVSPEEKDGLVKQLDAIEGMAAKMDALRGQAAAINPLKYATEAEKAAMGERFKPISDALSKIGLGSGGISPKEAADANRGIQLLRLNVLMEGHLKAIREKAAMDAKKVKIQQAGVALLGGD